MPPPVVLTRSTAARPASPPAPFRCMWISVRPGEARLRLRGELDVASAPQLECALRNALWLAPLVVVDLRAVTFMGAAGVRVLVNASIRARHAGRRVVVRRGPPDVDRVFALSETSHHVEVTDRPQRAARALRPHPHLHLAS